MLSTPNMLSVFTPRNHAVHWSKGCWNWSLPYCSLKSRECVESYLRAFFSPIFTMSDCVCHICDFFFRPRGWCLKWNSDLSTRCIVRRDQWSFLVQKECRALLQYVFPMDPNCSKRTCVDSSSTQVIYSATLIPNSAVPPQLNLPDGKVQCKL